MTEYIQKYVGFCEDKCEYYVRNNTIRSHTNTIQKRKHLYYDIYDSNEIAMLQILDNIHSYLIHTNNVSTDDEKKIISDNEIDNRIETKFVTNVINDSEFKSLNCGICWKYSDNKKDKQKNGNISNNRMVKAKYLTLKEELLSNNICCISQYQWMDIYIHVNKLWVTLYSKQSWFANDNGFLNMSAGIKAGTQIQLDQLIALFIAINFENVYKLFILNGCRLINNESINNLKKRHMEIAIWNLKLRQSIILHTF